MSAARSASSRTTASGTAGVAFNVKLMPVKVIDSDWDDIFGSPNQGTDDIVARGIRYAADNGAKVINMSIGTTVQPSPAPVIEDAIKYAVGKGVVHRRRGGQRLRGRQSRPRCSPRSPRACRARSRWRRSIERRHQRAYYSSTGSWVELAAPGGSFRGFRDGRSASCSRPRSRPVETLHRGRRTRRRAVVSTPVRRLRIYFSRARRWRRRTCRDSPPCSSSRASRTRPLSRRRSRNSRPILGDSRGGDDDTFGFG